MKIIVVKDPRTSAHMRLVRGTYLTLRHPCERPQGMYAGI